MNRALLLPLLLAAGLSGCDLLGIESGSVTAAKKEAEGKAVGGACRHAMRAIEDCYTLNPKAQKAAVYAGWREMDEYMRENKIDGVAPTLARNAARPEAAVRPGATGPERKPPVAADATKPAPTHES